jgi:hypothetical protein
MKGATNQFEVENHLNGYNSYIIFSSGWQFMGDAGHLNCFIVATSTTNSSCALCSQGAKTIDNILLGCVYAREAWFTMLLHYGWQHLTHTALDTVVACWLRAQKVFPKARRRPFDLVCLLLARGLWLEGNTRIF